MSLLLSLLLTAIYPSDSQEPKKKVPTEIYSLEETEDSVVEDSDAFPLQEIVIDDSQDDTYADLEEDETF